MLYWIYAIGIIFAIVTKLTCIKKPSLQRGNCRKQLFYAIGIIVIFEYIKIGLSWIFRYSIRLLKKPNFLGVSCCIVAL